LNAAGGFTASGVNSTAMSCGDISAPSAAKLSDDMSAVAAKGVISVGKRRARASPSASACCVVVSAVQIG
jgi:hypothetical protein